jgi:hypothetical protein
VRSLDGISGAGQDDDRPVEPVYAERLESITLRLQDKKSRTRLDAASQIKKPNYNF